MAKLLIVICTMYLASCVYGGFVLGPTGSTPPPCQASNADCAGRADGNYQSPYDVHDFIQCTNGNAFCQSCWPQSLFFSERCNQCLYNIDDPCYTTKSWYTVPTYACPDDCPGRGPNFKGNIEDSSQRKHYIACWNGVTVGCVNCPAPLLFNETWNQCLWEGKYMTQPL